MDSDTADVLMILDVLFGIFMGCVFVKFQKVCIMLGTSFLGSFSFWTGVFVLSHAPKLAPAGSGVQTALVYGVSALYKQEKGDDQGSMIDRQEMERVLGVASRQNANVQGNRTYRMRRSDNRGSSKFSYSPQEGSLTGCLSLHKACAWDRGATASTTAYRPRRSHQQGSTTWRTAPSG